MATLAATLDAVAARLTPLLDDLSARSDAQSRADAASLTRAIADLLAAASHANALDVETKLATDADALARLTAFTTQADARAAALAASQANVARFVALATHVGNAIVAVTGGNVAGCASALASACGDLGIRSA